MAQQKDPKTNKWMYYGSYVDQSGKRVQYKKRGFETKKEARKAEDDFRDIIAHEKEYISFANLCDEFFKYQAKRVKKSSLESDIYLKNTIEKDMDNLSDYKDIDTLQKFIDKCDDKYSKKYVSKIFYFLNKLFRFGVINGYLDINPMSKIQKDNRKNEAKKEMLFWEPDDFKKYIKVVDDPMYKAIFMTLYYMGMRRGEMMALRWDDIDLKNKSISIKHTYSTLTGEITTPKTNNSYRTITMPDVLVEELKSWKKVAESFVSFDPNGFVFGNDHPIAPETLRRNFAKYINETNRKLRSEAQIPIIRIHDLRHSHASYLINNMSAGFTDFDIAKRLGDTVATLHSTYAHWFKAADKGIVDFMNSAK